MITLDGSYGEGGGQILRTALSMSSVLGMPFRLTAIRANRPKPGLRPQHLTGLRATADITGARVAGGDVGSMEVVFEPGPAKAGNYMFDVSRIRGSAGSVTLVMQALLPALAMARGRSKVVVKGGTHVNWSPPFNYFSQSFLSAVSRMGVKADAQITRLGFYPKGGGEVSLSVMPTAGLVPVELVERGQLAGVTGVSAVARLPASIAARQAGAAGEYLARRGLAADIEIMEADSAGPGTFIYLSAAFENITLGFSALGERGKPAERVGEEAAASLCGFIESSACVEEHLADQLVPYMALAEGSSSMKVSRMSRHLLTNIWVVGRFLPGLEVGVEGDEGGPGMVRINGRGLEKAS